VHAWAKWIVYADGAWRLDTADALITETAKQVARTMFETAGRLEPERREHMWKWARRSETSGSVAAMVRLARGVPGVLVDHSQLDQRPELLNLLNGTLDLRTGRLLDHDPRAPADHAGPRDLRPGRYGAAVGGMPRALAARPRDAPLPTTGDRVGGHRFTRVSIYSGWGRGIAPQ
jgi:hypothetical protein